MPEHALKRTSGMMSSLIAGQRFCIFLPGFHKSVKQLAESKQTHAAAN